MEGSGATVEVFYLGYRGSPVTTQNSGHDRFPPVANSWGTIRPMPGMSPPLQTEDEGSPT
jgi:hypothetical protein